MIPPLSVGRSLDPKLQNVADSIARQQGLPLNAKGDSPVTDYIVKKQFEANRANKAKPNG